MNEARIIELAREAGICLPECWDLESVTDTRHIEDDIKWINEAPDPEEKQKRQEIFDYNMNEKSKQMKKLKTFVRLIQQEPT